MLSLAEFAESAPRIHSIFVRRHDAASNLCMLATIRCDGSPRISPMEPRRFGDRLVMVGMPGTMKFRDLDRDPRFCLHTATVDPQLSDGDVKIFGKVTDLQDSDFHGRFAAMLHDEIGLDLSDHPFQPFYVADMTGAAATELIDNHVVVTKWDPATGETSVIVE